MARPPCTFVHPAGWACARPEGHRALGYWRGHRESAWGLTGRGHRMGRRYPRWPSGRSAPRGRWPTPRQMDRALQAMHQLDAANYALGGGRRPSAFSMVPPDLQEDAAMSARELRLLLYASPEKTPPPMHQWPIIDPDNLP
jgi:hypothetical protein